MKTLNININDSAYKKLMNMKRRKRYPNLGDLIAYLIRQENIREFGDRSTDRMSTGGHLPGASPDSNANKVTVNKGEQNETQKSTSEFKG